MQRVTGEEVWAAYPVPEKLQSIEFRSNAVPEYRLLSGISRLDVSELIRQRTYATSYQAVTRVILLGAKFLQNNALCLKPAQNGTSASAMIFNTGFPEFGLITAPQYVPRSRWDMTPPPGRLGGGAMRAYQFSAFMYIDHIIVLAGLQTSLKETFDQESIGMRISGLQRSDLGPPKIGSRAHKDRIVETIRLSKDF